MGIRKILFIGIGLVIAACTLSSCHHRGLTGNPYIDAKEKPSQKQAKEDKKIIARGNKNYAKQEEENKHNIATSSNKFFKGKHFHLRRSHKDKKTRS